MQDKLIDNLMQMAGGAMNVVQALQENVREEVKKAVNSFMDDEAFVTREEFDALKAEIEALKKLVSPKIKNKQKVLIWSSFLNTIQLIKKHLKLEGIQVEISMISQR